MQPESDEVAAWLQKAEHDRRTAAAALAQDPPITDTAAFHCQQAVEKYLKAFLVACGEVPERTHDLRVRATQCSRRDPRFEQMVDGVAPLTAYAVRFRCPGVGEPRLEAVRRAQETVNSVRDLVRAILGLRDDPDDDA